MVETGSYTNPSTTYTVISDHYVISWYSVTVEVCGYYGFYGGCGYDPYGYNYFSPGSYGGFNSFYGGYGGYVQNRTYYLRSTGIAGTTSPPDTDPCGSSTSSKSYDGSSSAYKETVTLESRTCTEPPRPRVSIMEVGFKGDHKIKRLSDGSTIDPNDNEPTWVRNRGGNDNFLVAYTKGTSPTIFATLLVEQANTNYSSATVRVKKVTPCLHRYRVSV